MSAAELYGVRCFRSAASQFGYAESWLKSNGITREFPTREAAQEEAERLNRTATSAHVSYMAERFRA